ncbi:right-handed parallel beta-helix repeat-containing protein [Streptomyces acidiscabies]|uniref:Right-handed parallel beta-helix repeat-containing protein n=4 Tax=Streptomyces acidiscabies TaxID=42234 RepID=A0AAP6BJ42_9ACTN|nr:right-handed parallel beta-helix repeat-containing protein [Streptomyces acidiscabies]MDX2965530.1 right-handed parallel beta-helix repeat-containing protein [Streptomyces acidiscabies]MDX3793052.1 right-handed parallel beta-helix repeat-containing protein [Streptomyces acidiscabies]
MRNLLFLPGVRALARWCLTAVVAVGAVGCSGGGDEGAQGAGSGGTAAVVRVPQDASSVRRAVEMVRDGGLVLVSPGVYRESVTVAKPRVVLRGTDRNRVVIDGEFKRANGVTVTGAEAVVENLTVRNHLANGVLFTGVTDERLQAGRAGGSAYDPLDTAKFPPLRGFRASYVTAYNNALYGIYAFDARAGIIERSYASGQADSGIYVGQCRPCDTVVRDNVVEHNAVGLEVTNASERLYLLGNRASRNRVGLTLNSNDLEALGPQHGAVVAGNAFTDNNDPRSPEQADGGFGIGIGSGGGRENVVERNLVTGNRAAGVVLADVQGYPARDNTVRDNRVSGNGADLVLATGNAGGNCFVRNGEARRSPELLPGRDGCGAPAPDASGPTGRALGAVPVVAAPPGVSFQDAPAPPAQPNLPDAPSAPARAATGLPGRVDVRAYRVPS